MSADEIRWERLIVGLRSGDPVAAQDFCDLYGPALLRIADQRLPEGLRRRLGPEDVIQSACRTFFRRAQEGQFQLSDSESLWQLMCAITLTKIREQARFHLRQRRSLQRESSAPMAADETGVIDAPAAFGPTPAEAAEFADQFRHLLESLDDEQRQIVDLKLQEFTDEQIAEKMGCSERTVRRLTSRVKAALTKAFEVRAAE